MKRLAFIAALIAGASTAYAQGWYHPYNPYNNEPNRTEHEGWRGGWQPLAERYSAQQDRQFIAMGDRPLHRLRIEAAEGRPKITKIVIEFGGRFNGQTQVVSLYRPLAGYNRARDNELNGRDRPVRRIIVYSDPRFGGEYSVFGT